jgi:hypothetical protein
MSKKHVREVERIHKKDGGLGFMGEEERDLFYFIRFKISVVLADFSSK